MPPAVTVAELIASRLVAQGVERVYGLCGGHIQPIWDEVARAGITIVDVRHEASAVYMAQAESELTGRLAVALITAGPGLANAVAAIANAHVSRSSVLVISGRTPRPQTGMGAMQDIPQAELVAPICRQVEQVREVHHVLTRMDAVIAAALGAGSRSTGPAYIDFPTDLLDEPVPPVDVSGRAMVERTPYLSRPAADAVAAAAELVRGARRMVVIGGRPVRASGDILRSFLEQSRAFYLDTGECRGVIRDRDPSYAPAMRGQLMAEADLVVTVGRRMDFQLGYGSAALYAPAAYFLRIGTCFEETAENRRGDIELVGSVGETLAALVETGVAPDDPDEAWASAIRETNARRSAQLRERMSTEPVGADGRMHPYRLIKALNNRLTTDSVVVADGGDILSFARVGVRTVDYLDCGALGCLGVGVPFAIGAALVRSGKPTFALVGDGSLGFTAMEIDTAVRHRANIVVLVANNEAWNIERHDQLDRYDGRLVGVELPGIRYDVLARSLGAYGERIEDVADLPGALDRAIAATPAVLDVMVTRDARSPDYLNGIAAVPRRQALSGWDEAERARYGLN